MSRPHLQQERGVVLFAQLIDNMILGFIRKLFQRLIDIEANWIFKPLYAEQKGILRKHHLARNFTSQEQSDRGNVSRNSGDRITYSVPIENARPLREHSVSPLKLILLILLSRPHRDAMVGVPSGNHFLCSE